MNKHLPMPMNKHFHDIFHAKVMSGQPKPDYGTQT